jgi:hypothetical protein
MLLRAADLSRDTPYNKLLLEAPLFQGYVLEDFINRFKLSSLTSVDLTRSIYGLCGGYSSKIRR